MWKKIVSLVLVMAVVTASVPLHGCSAAQGSHQDVRVTTDDPTAVLYVNGERKGTGDRPLSLMLERNRDHTFLAETPDGRRHEVKIGRHISGAGWLDIAGTVLFIFPVVGLFAPGFWGLDETDIHLSVRGDHGIQSGGDE